MCPMGRKFGGRESRPAPVDKTTSRATGSPYAGITSLQSKAGNAAVTQLITVQRHANPTVHDDTQPSAPPPETLSEKEEKAPPVRAGSGSPGSRPAVGLLDLPGKRPARTPERLDSKAAGARFAHEMVGEEHEWATQHGPDARARALSDMIGRSLSDAGVSPVPGYALRTDLSPSTLGNFGYSNWRININQKLVGRPTLSPTQADEIASTFYHEGRHCDQWFRMARLRAGQGHAPADIARSMGIPNNVAVSAANSPLKAGSDDAREAQVWWDSVYGSHAAERDKVYGELAAADTANAAAAAAYAADHSPAHLAAWQATYARAKKAFAAYQALPEEVSARAAASTMKAALAEARRLNGRPAHDPLPRPPARDLHQMGDFNVPAPGGGGVA